MHRALADALTKGQERGQVRTDRTGAELATYLNTVLGGITATSRGGKSDWCATIEVALSALQR